MAMLFGSILATALVAQIQGGTIQGKVVDDQGKPVSDAQVVFYAPRPWGSSGEPAEVATKTDAGGQFRLASPRLKRAVFRLWSYRPGSAIALTLSSTQPQDLVLRKTQPRTVKVEGPDSRPVPGARLSPQVLQVAGRSGEVPEALAMSLAVTTGADGKATLSYLAGGDQLVAVRLTAASIGTQNLQLVENPGRDNQGATITIRLGSTRRLAGRVRNRAGQPVAGQEVQVWSKGGTWLRVSPVGFQDGPVRTTDDGSFHTPENLLVGSSYQVVVRAPGFEPIMSKWITIGEQPQLLLPLLQRPLRKIRGRVVDRQGKPLSDVEIFQSGDGPARTATKTDSDGRFALGGFREGPVFLFARREGFRYFGRLIRPSEDEIAVELIRVGERPAPELRTLPEPIPQEESRALTRRLMEPCWQAALAQKDPDAAYLALVCLAPADPLGVLRKLESEDSVTPLRVPFIKGAVARALARSDPARAEKVAESIDSPRDRCAALAAVADALPTEARDRKLALLARAAVHAKAAKEPLAVFAVASRLLDLGEKETVKALVAEYVGIGKVIPQQRIPVGYRLICVDPPTALSIARELSTSDRVTANLILQNLALGLAADNPVEAERVLRMVPQEEGRIWLPPAVAWKMAMSDPARARRLVDECQRYYDSPQTYLYLACGLKGRDPSAADEAFWKGIKGIDRLLEEGAEFLAMQIRGGTGALLPLVEQIDPSLVPEVLWRAVAARPVIGNPRSLNDPSLSELVQFLSWYDRDVAAAVFEADRAMMEQSDDRELATRGHWFLSWLLLDPRATVARVEQLRATTDLDTKAILGLREDVGLRLGRSYEDQWRSVWYLRGYGQMKAPLDRDIW